MPIKNGQETVFLQEKPQEEIVRQISLVMK